jgi:hypothetical protein
MRDAPEPRAAAPPAASFLEACALLCPCLLWLRRAAAAPGAAPPPPAAYNSLPKERETSEIPLSQIEAALYGQPRGS